MPQWLLVAGSGIGGSLGDGETSHRHMFGDLWGAEGEDNAQALARDTYTLADLLVRVIANTIDGTTTFRTRVNGGNGNQDVSVLTTQTGTFQDTVDSDALGDADLFCYQIVAGGTEGLITFSILSTTLETASNNTPIIGSARYVQSGASSTYYFPIMGGDFLSSASMSHTETDAQYTFRTAAILSNLRYNANAAKLTGATVTIRINGADGNLTFSVPQETSGTYEDAVNTDIISIGDEVSLKAVLGGATGGGAGLYLYSGCLKSTSLGRQTACAYANDAGLISQDWDEIFYFPLGGTTNNGASTATEADVQCLTRMVIFAKNLFVNVPTNTTDGARTVNTRINGGDGSLTVSIGASTTGLFEDLVNSDSLIATDLYNYKVGGGGSSGAISTNIIGFEQGEEEAAVGLENKSANMGAKMVAAGLI